MAIAKLAPIKETQKENIKIPETETGYCKLQSDLPKTANTRNCHKNQQS